MKKKFFSLIFPRASLFFATAVLIVTCSEAFSQVGIGTSLPNASAQLDVVSLDKGVLFPRVSLLSITDASTIANGNITSLFVYNTATAGTVPNNVIPGYYYWDGSKWARVASTSDVINLITSNQTVTNLVDNGNGTITYTNEAGTAQTINIAAMVTANETLTTLVDNGNGTITYTDELGVATIINLSQIIGNYETITNLIDNGNGTITYTNEDGVAQTINIASIINANETLTTLVYNGNGTMTYTDENGSATIINLAQIIANYETVTNIVINANGSFTYTNEDGIAQTVNIAAMIAANETLTTLVNNNNGTLTYTDEDGVAHIINLAQVIANYETVTNLVDNGNGTISYTNENGIVQTVNIAAMVTANQTITSLNSNGNGTYTFINESGVTTTFPATPEPWFNQSTLTPATANTQSVYIQAPWVGIGTSAGQTAISGERLFVQGSIRTTNSYYADYVFEEFLDGESVLNPDYSFNDLETVEAYIKENKHLPGVTGINDLQKTDDGYAYDISSLSIQSLEKIEELYLHVITQNKLISEQQKELDSLKKELENLKESINSKKK